MAPIPRNKQASEEQIITGEISPLTADRLRFFRNKYFFDRVTASVLLVLTSPLTLLLGLLVRLTSPGPAFYRQERVGLNGTPFEMIKLRSMVVDAEKAGKPVWCVKGDHRITPLGRVLRKLHLDELPQLLNVARGEMSLVGPRPERPSISESLADDIEGYIQRLRVKPGITGLSQINLPPDESVDDVRRKQTLDLCYIDETSFGLELRILMATVMRVFGIKGETVMRLMRLCRRQLLVEQGLAAEKSRVRLGIRRKLRRPKQASLQQNPTHELVSSDGRQIDPMPVSHALARSDARRPK